MSDSKVQMQRFTCWRCPSSFCWSIFLLVCSSVVKYVKSFAMWQQLAASRDGNRTHCVKFRLCSVRPVSQFGSVRVRSVGTVLVSSVWLKTWVLVVFGFCSIPISSSVHCSRWLNLGSVLFGYCWIFVCK